MIILYSARSLGEMEIRRNNPIPSNDRERINVDYIHADCLHRPPRICDPVTYGVRAR